MTIWFDMDGTLCRLYDVPNWLEMLRAYDPTPYAEAAPKIRLATLARYLNRLSHMGYEIGVISWGSKVSTPAYDEAVEIAKRNWLRKHLPSVEWDAIHIVPYGTPKQEFRLSPSDILFDDEQRNRDNWGENAFPEMEILPTLHALANMA